VETEDTTFDPSVHEAVHLVPGEQDGRVAAVYEKGYRLKGRLLRPAKVGVTTIAPASDRDF
jgi:molecular chaperone GrpE